MRIFHTIFRAENGRKPLVSFDSSGGEGKRRARLEGAAEGQKRSMSPATRSRSRAVPRRRTTATVRVVKGRVKLRVAGYTGVQSLSPAHLVRHIGSTKLRLAAKQVLRLTKKKSGLVRRRKSKGRRRKKGVSKKKKKKKKRRRKKGKKRRKRTAKRSSAANRPGRYVLKRSRRR